MFAYVLVAFLYIWGPKGANDDPELRQAADVYASADECSDAATKLKAEMLKEHPKDFLSFSFTCNPVKAPEPPKES